MPGESSAVRSTYGVTEKSVRSPPDFHFSSAALDAELAKHFFSPTLEEGRVWYKLNSLIICYCLHSNESIYSNNLLLLMYFFY
jgi:hypothetical protein